MGVSARDVEPFLQMLQIIAVSLQISSSSKAGSFAFWCHTIGDFSFIIVCEKIKEKVYLTDLTCSLVYYSSINLCFKNSLSLFESPAL